MNLQDFCFFRTFLLVKREKRGDETKNRQINGVPAEISSSHPTTLQAETLVVFSTSKQEEVSIRTLASRQQSKLKTRRGGVTEVKTNVKQMIIYIYIYRGIFQGIYTTAHPVLPFCFFFLQGK